MNERSEFSRLQYVVDTNHLKIRLFLALAQLDEVRDELSCLRADLQKQRLALHAPALPSEEEIAKAICCPPRSAFDGHLYGCLCEDDCWAERPEIVRQARAVLALLGKAGSDSAPALPSEE
jgi:hypothetical protein